MISHDNTPTIKRSLRKSAIRQNHSVKRPANPSSRCSFCGKNVFNLRLHQPRCQQRRVACPICKAVVNNKNLSRHMQGCRPADFRIRKKESTKMTSEKRRTEKKQEEDLKMRQERVQGSSQLSKVRLQEREQIERERQRQMEKERERERERQKERQRQRQIERQRQRQRQIERQRQRQRQRQRERQLERQRQRQRIVIQHERQLARRRQERFRQRQIEERRRRREQEAAEEQRRQQELQRRREQLRIRQQRRRQEQQRLQQQRRQRQQQVQEQIQGIREERPQMQIIGGVLHRQEGFEYPQQVHSQQIRMLLNSGLDTSSVPGIRDQIEHLRSLEQLITQTLNTIPPQLSAAYLQRIRIMQNIAINSIGESILEHIHAQMTGHFVRPTIKKGLTKDEIAQLAPTKNSSGGVQCPICILDINKGEMQRCLPCTHQFHSECLDPWFKNNSNCPKCRAQMKNN